MRQRKLRTGAAIALTLALLGGAMVAVRSVAWSARTHIVGYFDNSNGLFPGDEVRILGVPVGAIDSIEPQPDRVKVTFWVARKYKVPADVRAAILSPQLVTSRSIQLTPAYTGGPVMTDGAVIPETRTAVPVEWDELREQLERLTDALQPTQPGGVSTLGAFINTAAENLRGRGADIRETVTKMSQAISALGDHSNDIFSTIKNLSIVVSALHDSSTLLRELNSNLAAVTELLAADPDAVGKAVKDMNDVVSETTRFIADNREALGTTTDKLVSISSALEENIPAVKQALHVFPHAAQNFVNIYQPTQAALSGALAFQNFANPISFLCGAIQAASRLNSEQSAKLCVQYLAPIVKNRLYSFFPAGENLFVGQSARPNEITYTEDWLRPDYVPAPPAESPDKSDATPPKSVASTPPPIEPSDNFPPESVARATDPAAGLPGLMVPAGGGS
ncbi:virulence factor Mce family protein [Mycolicibacter kumamotonensis]|uniref:Virulence factor Mce family protein n=1 Tax=Mycolicibacter kumamotonensis TaxID=354243 RepID=A0A7K3LBG1_9MYCO|nr:virulence factor Mce family protein [Mycolicibacter kumamotonensis]NDJ89698.1 virulence factor Mce family protein [Mycolicibacter kumamotonensis]